MHLKIINKSQFKTAEWSGGTTTELVIFPERSSYKALNFDFRLSIARVDIEKSIFTALPGVSRTLMVLDGTLELHHQGHYSKKLKKFDFDTFKGDWTTTSFGKAMDFNLMTTGDTSGTLASKVIAKSDSLNLSETSENLIITCYLLSGRLEIKEQSPGYLEAGDLLWIKPDMGYMPSIIALANSEVIVSTINLPGK